jgi:hypothetical protein
VVAVQDRLGRTAPQAAADAGFKDTLLVLLESGRVDPSQRDFQGRNLVHWAATLDCVDVMQMLVAMSGVELYRKDKHGKLPIDITYLCKCANVGRFLSQEMKRRAPPGVVFFDIYGWDAMYNNPFIWDVERDITRAEAGRHEEGLMAREARRNKNFHDEWHQLRLQYPDKLWGLVTQSYIFDDSTPIPDRTRPAKKTKFA